jgi:hypothetical protein
MSVYLFFNAENIQQSCGRIAALEMHKYVILMRSLGMVLRPVAVLPAVIRLTLAQIKNASAADVLYLAGPTGFEPAISSVTGRRDRPTSLRAQELFEQGKS